MKFACILKSDFYRNVLTLAFKIDDIMKCFNITVQILYKSNNSIRFMKFNMLYFRFSPVFIDYGKCWIQVCRLVHTAFDIFFLKPCLFKNFRIRKKINLSSCLFCLTQFRKKAVFQFDYRNALLIAVMMNISLTADLHIHISRQCIHDRRTDTMQTTACLVCVIIKFSACMKGGKYDTGCRYAFCMHSNRNSSSIILNRAGTIRLKRYPDRITHTSQMLIHRVVYNLIDQMIQSFGRNTSDIHSRALTNGL
ncbi:putative uncharacterized protein [Roseburia sp. CAG:197]|nr:putative uncharacterized protein [Roseburia sp. CAG:197]